MWGQVLQGRGARGRGHRGGVQGGGATGEGCTWSTIGYSTSAHFDCRLDKCQMFQLSITRPALLQVKACKLPAIHTSQTAGTLKSSLVSDHSNLQGLCLRLPLPTLTCN